MRLGRMLLAVMLCLVVSAPSLADSKRPPAVAPDVANFEEAAKSFLPGKWRFDYRSDNPEFSMTGTSTYHADGTAVYEAELLMKGQRLPFRFGANWRVEGNKMITVITASSAPAMVPVGEESVDTILELSAEVFHYMDDEEHMAIKELRIHP